MGPFETWIGKLRLAWMGPTAKRLWGAFAYVLGDLALSWARQANLEHLPQEALDEDSLALLGSARQIDRGPSETSVDFAARLTTWIQTWARAGTPLGLLLALQYAGYDNVYLVQQNGLFFYLYDGPPHRLTKLGAENLATLIAPMTSSVTPGYSVPAGIPWFTFDSDPEHTSRFAIMFGNQGTLSAADLLIIRSIVKLWKPGKALCVGLYTLDSLAGDFFDLGMNASSNVRTFDDLVGLTYDQLAGTSHFYASE